MVKPKLRFNPPPGWPKPRPGWTPPPNWAPPAEWPEAPEGWQLWVADEEPSREVEERAAPLVPVSGESVASEDASFDLGQRIAQLEAENQALRELALVKDEREELILLDDDAVLQSVGIYQYRHPLEDSVQYRDRLRELAVKLAEHVRSGDAISASRDFTMEGSISKGAKLTSDLSKLMLLAYNSEAGSCIRAMRVGNLNTAVERLNRIKDRISRLGRLMQLQISESFHELRLEEIELTSDFLVRKQEEKEAAREERARLREEKRVMKELAEERERLDKERSHLEAVLSQLHQRGDDDPELTRRLAEVDSAIEANDFRAANIRAGHVYVISNRGAFGPGVVKIGLTRRLTPRERIDELSGAAVPFRFDIHCLFFSEDAVGLEAELHRHFADRRVNMVNSRKEFFFATPGEVRAVLAEKSGALVEFVESAEALEFLQSRSSWPQEG